MSSYSREASTRPGVSFGTNCLHNHPPPPRRQPRVAGLRPPPSSSSSSSRIGGRVDNDGGGIDNDVGRNVGGGGGISRFGARERRDRQRQHHQQQQQRRQPPSHRQEAPSFLAIDRDRHREEEEAPMFQEIEAPGGHHDDEYDEGPIEGSIHAHNDDVRNFSQVTLSQLSDGPSVRSFRSQQHRRVGGVVSSGLLGGITAPPPRLGGANLSKRRIPRRREDEDDDADSLRSSQPLLSQAVGASQQHRPPSNGGGGGGGGGGDRPSSGGGAAGLISHMPTSTLASIAPRRLAGGTAMTTTTTTTTTTMASSHHRPQQLPPSNKRGREEDASDVGDRGTSRASSSGHRGSGGLLSGLPRLGDYYGNRRAMTPASDATTSGCHRPSTTRLFPPLLPERRHPTPAAGGRTMTASGSAMSSTLLAATLSTPSRAFRNITGLAARTTAGLAALSPFRGVNGRIRSTIGSALLGSAYATSSSSYTSRGCGPSSSTVPAITRLGAAGGLSALPSSTTPRNRSPTGASPPGASSATETVNCTSGYPATGELREIDDVGRIQGSHQAPLQERRRDGKSLISSSMTLEEEYHGDRSPPRADESNLSPSAGLCDGANSVTLDDRGANSTLNITKPLDSDPRSIQPNHQDDYDKSGSKSSASNHASRNAPRQHENDLNATDPHDASSRLDGTTSLDGMISNAKDKICDIQSQTADDDISKGSGSTLDLHAKTEDIIAATRALHQQHQRFEKSKREFIELNERARQVWKEEYGKLEALQISMHNKYGTLQGSMDDFSTKISSAAHDHEFALRNLVSTSMNDLRQESIRAVEATSQQNEKNNSRLLADVRSLIETEARKYLSEVMAGMVNTINTKDAAAINDDATIDAEDHTVGVTVAGKENRDPCLELERGKSLQVNALRAEPVMTYLRGSPLCDKRPENKSLTPLPRGILSASTTPFSRKATPQQNNHANSMLSPQPANHSRRGIDFDSELRSDFARLKTGGRGDNSPQDGYSSQQLQSVVGKIRHEESKVKVTQEATSSSKSKQLVEVPTKKIERRGCDRRSGRTQSEPDVVVSEVDKCVATTLKNDGSATNSKTTQNKSVPMAIKASSSLQDVVGKRGHSEVTNASKSPRRSKRLKEVNRVELMALPAAPIANKCKSAPSQVTPKDDATSIIAIDRGDARDSSSSVVCSSTPGRAGEKNAYSESYLSLSNGLNTLLGTSVTVPNHGEFEDELIRFEDSDDGFGPEKGSLTSFLPFGGFRSRSKGSRTISKRKKRSILRYDFDDFDFS